MSEQNTLQPALTNWLQQRHPERQALQLTDFSSPTAGASNETILFSACWRDAGQVREQALVLRLEPVGEGIFPHYDLALQYRTMERLQNSGVAAPVVCGFEASPAVLGRPFYLMERIDGRYLSDNPPYQMEGWLCSETPAARRQMWESGIRATAAVNRIDWRARGFADLWDSARFASPLAQLLDEYRQFMLWAESKGRPYEKLHRAYEYLLSHQPENQPVALCWGDAKPPNVMFRDGEVVGVLDWEMVHLGNPVHDLAWWFVLDDSLTEGLGLPKLEGIPARQQLIELWQRESGFSAADFDYYEFLSCFQFAIIMHRVGTRLTAQGIFTPEMAFDINNNCTPLLDRQLAKFGA